MRTIAVLALCLMALLTTRCHNPNKGALSEESRTELDRFVDTHASLEKKYWMLADKMAQALEEAAAIPDNAGAMDHLRRFASDNDYAIELISTEFDGWQRHVNDDDLMHFTITLYQQRSGKKLRTLHPAFERRISVDPALHKEYLEWIGVMKLVR
ncbi:hypothetical protein [Pontibacter sp. G13]|uniref:hypothetical protein n=1 Tax=Pontibacter sp. G13 TaxID=3074898 RepID=UPI00288B6B14|nr:hypothetical protein [Pontibacter sp. G13]WNJ18524.1 hypothetical protein RJD25_27020 [Pontibacter sp. G13]